MLIVMVNIMILNSAIRIGVVASLLASTSIAGSRPFVPSCMVSCGCHDSAENCRNGENCQCTRVPDNRDANRGLPTSSVHRTEPWSHAMGFVQVVVVSCDSLESRFLPAEPTALSHSLVCLGIRLNC
jgi:hypothetical protein